MLYQENFLKQRRSSNKDLLLNRRNIILAHTSLTVMASDWLETVRYLNNKMLALKCIATCSYIALFFTVQCSLVSMWQMYARTIHTSSENFSHLCLDQKDTATILNGWIAEEHTFEMARWFACFCVNSTLIQPLGRVPLLVREIQY